MLRLVCKVNYHTKSIVLFQPRCIRWEDESFSDVIDRLLKKDKADLSEYFGSLKDNPLLDAFEEDSRKIRATSIASTY